MVDVPRHRRSWALPLAFLLLLALPVYALSVVIAVRSGLFRFGGPPLSDNQVKALWALVGSGLAASAAVVGGLFTKAHNDRTLALSAQEARRLNLDTAIASLDLLRYDGGYSPPGGDRWRAHDADPSRTPHDCDARSIGRVAGRRRGSVDDVLDHRASAAPRSGR
jgi:hypothetical protein